MPLPEVAEVLEHLPFGKSIWLSLLGTSMEPLLHSGDGLKVLRCEEAEVCRGDIAVLRRSDGALIAHLVRAGRPVSTTSFLGRDDPPGLRLLGRVIALRRWGGVVAFPRPARWALWLAHLAAAAAYRQPVLRAAARRLRHRRQTP